MLRIQEPMSRRDLLRVGGLSARGPDARGPPAPRPAPTRPSIARSAGRRTSSSSSSPAARRSTRRSTPSRTRPPRSAASSSPSPPASRACASANCCRAPPRWPTSCASSARWRTGDPNHESSGYWVNTGHRYTRAEHARGPPDRLADVRLRRQDAQAERVGAVHARSCCPSRSSPTPASSCRARTAASSARAGIPSSSAATPPRPGFEIEGFSLPPELPPVRLAGRRGLVQQLDQRARWADRNDGIGQQDRTVREALSIVLSSKARAAFRLEREPAAVRDRYGRNKWGQSLLLARRLIEAGVRMVFVNWPREPGDMSAGNPLWDTHAQNNDRMKDVLCPQFDTGFPALIEDLRPARHAGRDAGRRRRRDGPDADVQRLAAAATTGATSGRSSWPARASARRRSSGRATSAAPRSPTARSRRPT